MATITPPAPDLVPAPLIAECRAILAQTPAALVTDIDGTISQIAPTPETAFVADDIRDSLTRLTTQLAVVCVVSGRSAPTAATMLNLPTLIYIGNHGMERLHLEEIWQNPDAAAATSAIAAALDSVAAHFPAAEHPWLVLENKGISATVHYRLAPDPLLAQALLLPVITAAANAHGLVVTEGRLIFEFRPNVPINKGSALADLVDRYGLRGLIFLGDDLTDVDGFLALQTLREQGTIAGLAIGVLGAESHPRVRETMDVGIPGVPAAAALLHALSQPAVDP